MVVKYAAGRGKKILAVFLLTRRCQIYVGSTTSVLQRLQHVHTAGGRKSSSLKHRSSTATNASANINSKNKDASSRLDHNQSEILIDSSPESVVVALPRQRDATLGSTVVSNISTDASSVARSSRQSDSKRGLRHTVMEFLRQFIRGTKLLWMEMGQARKTSRKKKMGEVVTFREDRLLRQVPRDVMKALPLVMVFAVPFAGYIGPAIGFFYPKNLLPAQFWTPCQRLEFMLQDAIEQEVVSFPELLRCLAGLDVPPRPNSTPRQLQDSLRWFDDEGSLERLSRHHLIQLVKACNTLAPFKKATARFMLKSALVGWLRTEASAISDDDVELRRLLSYGGTLERLLETDGGGDEDSGGANSMPLGKEETLPPAEVAVLCWERGLLRSQHWHWLGGDHKERVMDGKLSAAEVTAMLKSLQDWLSLYDVADAAPAFTAPQSSSEYSETYPKGKGARAIPPSMILHASALLRLPHSAGGDFPVCHLRVR